MLTPEQVATYVTPILGAIAVAYLDIQRKRADRVANQAALERASEVKRKLDDQNEAAAKANAQTGLKMEEIHIDVNSKMAAQKKKTWDFALSLASRADATPAEKAAAREAEKDYRDHMEAQARADERRDLFLKTQRQAATSNP